MSELWSNSSAEKKRTMMPTKTKCEPLASTIFFFFPTNHCISRFTQNSKMSECDAEATQAVSKRLDTDVLNIEACLSCKSRSSMDSHMLRFFVPFDQQSHLPHSNSTPDLEIALFVWMESSGLIVFANACQPRRYGIINCINEEKILTVKLKNQDNINGNDLKCTHNALD